MFIPHLRTRAIAVKNSGLLLRKQWEELRFAQWSTEYCQRIEAIKRGINIDDAEILSGLAELGGMDVAGWSDPIPPISEQLPKTRELLEFVRTYSHQESGDLKYIYDQQSETIFVNGRMRKEELDVLLGIYKDSGARSAIRRLYHQSQVGKRAYEYVYTLHSRTTLARSGLYGTQVHQKPIYLAA
jgi:hypothetical protein